MTIETSVSNGIARLVLSRPEKRNAFDGGMIATITDILKEWSQLNDIRALVISAAGETFCAGADLGWMKRTANLDYQANRDDARKLAGMMEGIDHFPAPVITLVQGAAFGGALGIVCASDIVFASSDARFCLSEVRLGIIPAVISPYVIRVMGERAARRFMLTSELIDSQKALAMGFIHQLVDQPEDLPEQAEQVLTLLKNNSPAAVRACKQLIADVSGRPINSQLMEMTSEAIANIRQSSEGQEGLSAFLEKRSPAWQEKE
ncbi:enoyl-CoA hydratase-related protein [Sansalvadorimonas sp. 2012CJ34-2]|uniref:Enoyl-CoA hydratase-related protein n=1 Tax=Parendozoicomonas callyspongiae TaxID=2942213 RepID=A0ABT0PET6_9GAMM|nr:enoyl-CoA hydratase-related protein [Sansalvadorimonas sp. 2012CJ34-2]MCL6269898.1 enoyl-CoA hydratase-related protein [Sansalvadorimonas sp. 2012CJ34-2]